MKLFFIAWGMFIGVLIGMMVGCRFAGTPEGFYTILACETFVFIFSAAFLIHTFRPTFRKP